MDFKNLKTFKPLPGSNHQNGATSYQIRRGTGETHGGNKVSTGSTSTKGPLDDKFKLKSKYAVIDTPNDGKFTYENFGEGSNIAGTKMYRQHKGDEATYNRLSASANPDYCYAIKEQASEGTVLSKEVFEDDKQCRDHFNALQSAFMSAMQ